MVYQISVEVYRLYHFLRLFPCILQYCLCNTVFLLIQPYLKYKNLYLRVHLLYNRAKERGIYYEKKKSFHTFGGRFYGALRLWQIEKPVKF